MRRLGLILLSVFVAVACRPHLGPSPTPTPSYVAGTLIPSQAMTVGVHLPGAPGALAASVLDIGASEGLAAGNITVTTEAFSSGDQAFVGAGRTDAVDLFVTDAAPALFANASGADLVLIASFQHSSTWRLLTLADGPVASLADLAGGSMYVDGVHGDEAPVLLAMKDAGISLEGLTFVYPDDPAIPFDATLLHDGTVKAALVRSFDGFARTAQYVDPATGASVGLAAYREISLSSTSDGLGIWASAASIAADDAKTAVAATLIAWSQSLTKCRDDVETCAMLVVDSSISDLQQESLAWDLNQINASLWPNPAGLFEIDSARLGVAISSANSVGIGSPASADSLIDRSILKLAQEQWIQGVDRNGAGWTPLDLPLP